MSTPAQQASGVPINDEPRAVVASIVSAVRRVMRDPTWRCAVLSSENAELLPPGCTTARRMIGDPTPSKRGPLGGRLRVDLPARRKRARGEHSPSSTSPSATACAPSCTRRGLAAWIPRRPRSTFSRWWGSTPARHSTTHCCTRRSAARPMILTGSPRYRRLPPRCHPRPADPAHEHRCPGHRLRANRQVPESARVRPRVDHPPGGAAPAHGQPAARGISP